MTIGHKGQGTQNINMNQGIDNDRQMILDAKKKGGLSVFKTYIRLSGPGWLQSGITLGGGSLSSSLYLGVLVGFSFLWLQPLAMILGIIMLSAISYVTLSTGQRPLRGINEHVSPVLGWGWLIASMMANLVWSMPQFSLGTAAIQQNVMPGIFGGTPESLIKDPFTAKLIVVLGFLAICIITTLLYDAGGKGVKIFEYIIKAVVSMIVLCFFGVVLKLSMEGKIVWGEIFSGLIPDFSLFVKPTDKLMRHIELVGEPFRPFWTNMIVNQQRDVMISAAATAVGINMTFLLPYSMLKKGWDKHFRGLAIFDLSTGLFIPFILATGCVVIASGSQFHAKSEAGFVAEQEGGEIKESPAYNLIKSWNTLMTSRLKTEVGQDEFVKLMGDILKLPEETQEEQRYKEKMKMERFQGMMSYADKNMAAMLVTRDSFNLADTLAPLTGDVVAQYIFGFGVLGMALSTAMILMTINGLCFCELLNRPPQGWPMKVGTLMVSIGALGPFYWKDAAAYLSIPTSVFGMVLLPIAYFAFFLLMNQKSYLGENIPRGMKRIIWNMLMILAAGAASFGCVWSLWSKLQWKGIGILVGFIALSVIVHFLRKKLRIA